MDGCLPSARVAHAGAEYNEDIGCSEGVVAVELFLHYLDRGIYGRCNPARVYSGRQFRHHKIHVLQLTTWEPYTTRSKRRQYGRPRGFIRVTYRGLKGSHEQRQEERRINRTLISTLARNRAQVVDAASSYACCYAPLLCRRHLRFRRRPADRHVFMQPSHIRVGP